MSTSTISSLKITYDNWNFQRGWERFKPNKPQLEGYEYLLKQNICVVSSSCFDIVPATTISSTVNKKGACLGFITWTQACQAAARERASWKKLTRGP